MRRTFPIHDLSDDEFEDLVVAICLCVLGTGTIVFATGKDGGRDAVFTGSAMNFPSGASPLQGKFVIQAKHTAHPAASCSDKSFGKVLASEHPKIVALIAGGELEHYLCFTNRKAPATDAVKKCAVLKALGLKSSHLLGVEQIRTWLTHNPKIWSDLGFDRFETPLRLQTNDITEVITAFHAEMGDGKFEDKSGTFTYIPKSQKNKINKLSAAYFEEIRTRSLPYFKAIEDFLRNPRNLEFKDLYEDTADEIRRKILAMSPPFETFDEALTCVIDVVTSNNPALKKRRRFATVFLHYMYYTCDIGQHADAV